VANEVTSPNSGDQASEAEPSWWQRFKQFLMEVRSWLLSKGTWLFVTGALALGIGTWSVFSTRSALGSVAVVVAGALLIALWAFGDRILLVRYKGLEIQFAGDLLSMAQLLEEAGDEETAEILRDRANRYIRRPQQQQTEPEAIGASPADYVRTAIEYERSVHDRLVALAHEKGWKLTRQALASTI